jgi:hypothetical protein
VFHTAEGAGIKPPAFPPYAADDHREHQMEIRSMS